MSKLWKEFLLSDIEHIHEILKRIEQNQGVIMSGQASIDAAVAQLAATQAVEATAVSTLAADVTAIGAALAAGSGVNPDALDAAVAAQASSDSALVSSVNDVTALVPPAPAPAS